MANGKVSDRSLSHLSARVRRHIRALGFDTLDGYYKWCRHSGFTPRTNKNTDQMKQEILRRAGDTESRGRQTALEDHIKAMGFDSIQTYRGWCRKNGLGAGLHKSASQRAREINIRRIGSRVMADRGRELWKDLPGTARRMVSGDLRKNSLTHPVLLRLFELLEEHRDANIRRSFVELVVRADEVGMLTDVAPVLGRIGAAPGNTLLDGLLALATHWTEWLRPVGSWRPAAKSRNHRFGELARHLLANYDVPPFMDAAWFAGTSPTAIEQQSWFAHIGRGANIRTAAVPLAMTRKMAHLFLQAPDSLTISQALRWAQTLGYGGDLQLADHIIATRLAESLDDDHFWVEVVHFFINHPMLDYDQFAPIVDFVHYQRDVPVERVLPDGTTTDAPLQPEFSMKGRTVERLLELVDRWHRQADRSVRVSRSVWEPSGIQGFEKYEERDGRSVTWSISEITTYRGLVDEGRAMHHCVATYAPYCVKGQKSVWSLTVADMETGYTDRVLTIALNNAGRRVVQARGRCNALPGVRGTGVAANRVLKVEGDRLKRGRSIMHQWGEKEDIRVPRIT